MVTEPQIANNYHESHHQPGEENTENKILIKQFKNLKVKSVRL